MQRKKEIKKEGERLQPMGNKWNVKRDREERKKEG
jgi:hypothetical protein|tara:strand:+ start:429 stop:533 length:105 start_codon:yes stop_codon:yes gene_type:complete